MDIGEQIRRAREAAGLSQATLGARMGVDAGRISRWERGLHAPQSDSVLRVADALETTFFIGSAGLDLLRKRAGKARRLLAEGRHAIRTPYYVRGGQILDEVLEILTEIEEDTP